MGYFLASAQAEGRWRAAGQPYCEHPGFASDASHLGRDPYDDYCTTCGAVWANREPGGMPEPRGNR